MSTLIAIVVLVAVSSLFYVLLGLALEHADGRAEQTRSTELRSRTKGD
jgi:hypothetical protein